MKRKAPYLSHAAVFFLVVMAREAQSLLTAEDLLNQKIEELNRFVGVVETNSGNCDATEGCSYSCSRLSCREYGTQGDKNYACMGVQNNTFCNSCTDRNFDFSRSYLRRVDLVDENIMRTVCTHQNLDDSFLASSLRDPDHFFRVFFGAVDGTFRIYPGADEACTANGLLPNPYEPRTRPWYIESTYVPKIVTILIDTGFNMRNLYNGATNGETFGSKAIATAVKFLPTLRRDQDYISIVAFDASGNKPLNETMIYNGDDLLKSYNASLNKNIFQTKLITNATATSKAINTAISDLNSDSSSAPAHYLKVLIVLTTGEEIKNLSNLSVTPSSGVNVFVYNFFPSAQTAQCDPSTGVSIEYIQVKRIDNPLYAIQSYFSFMATAHKSFMRESIDYGQRYQDFSGIDNSTLTLSKAAFGPSGELLGVVGIDFFEKKMDQQYPPNIQFQSIVTASRQHQISYITATNTPISRCINNTDPCPNLASASMPGFLCEKSNGNAKIGCCGSCLPSKEGISKELIIVIVVLGTVVLVVICCGLYWWSNARTREEASGSPRADEATARSGVEIGGAPGLKAPGNRKDCALAADQ